MVYISGPDAVNMIQLGGLVTVTALPPVVDADIWQRELDALGA